MKILRASDLVRIKISESTLVVQPLSYAKKLEMAKFVTTKDGKEVHDWAGSIFYTVKNSIKGIEGVSDNNLNEIKLEFEGDQLTDESASDVMGMIESHNGMFLNISRIAGHAGKDIKSIVDPETGKTLDGVEIVITPKTQPPKLTT